MGWTSTGDPYANVGDSALSFESEEAAKAFAEKQGWEYTVKKRHTTLLKIKSYADNFKDLPRQQNNLFSTSIQVLEVLVDILPQCLAFFFLFLHLL